MIPKWIHYKQNLIQEDYKMDNMGTTYSSSDFQGYDDFGPKLSGESQLVTLLKGIVGAIVGALPGFGLWIIVGKAGYVASAIGLLLAFGSVCGYTFMASKNELPAIYGIIVCVIVMLVMVYLAQRIIFCWELADTMKNGYTIWRDAFMAEIRAVDGIDLSDPEISSLVDEYTSEKAYLQALNETLGFSDFSFSGCFEHFSDILEYADSKSDFYWALGKSYLFAFLGGGAIFAGIEKKAKKTGANFI